MKNKILTVSFLYTLFLMLCCQASLIEDVYTNSSESSEEQNKTSEAVNLAAIEADAKALLAKKESVDKELKSNINAEKSASSANKKNASSKQPDLNYYLKLAIKNRPDLKADIEAIKAARTELYDSSGTLAPPLNISNSSPNKSKGNKENIITKIHDKYEKYSASLNAFKKKWHVTVNEIKKAYENLNSQITLRKDAENAMRLAEQKCNMLNYNETTNTAALKQAEKDLANTQKSFIKTEKEVEKARRSLYKVCGISINESKKPSITTLNQAQQDYIGAQENYIGSQIETLKAEAKMEAAIGTQH